ncbi:DUF1579 domain-containing protein [Psychroserpens algicola]|uniref:DUF1579 domain-containing protein n=1 Tax=Psychroserpens algicola TaxID=1719034 RepID=A0ABT0H665_9FLAO|nr:DUF1579 domain-containing protein [Psychroserpens algicola]MCK8479858.1 DUF1579 domain-containing protein [Psychroserpens algicola]
MKKLLLLMTITMFCSYGFSQTQEQIKAWQDHMTPGKYHKWLATFDGEWTGDVKMWMDPSQPPQASKMSTTNTMIMNGLYQKSTHEGIMMGRPFKGQGLIGYDNSKKMFISTWIDNMGSGIMIMDGNVDKDGKILTTIGIMDDPMTGEALKVRQVLTYMTDDKHLFEMYMNANGEEFKTMEITYTRKK